MGLAATGAGIGAALDAAACAPTLHVWNPYTCHMLDCGAVGIRGSFAYKAALGACEKAHSPGVRLIISVAAEAAIQ